MSCRFLEVDFSGIEAVLTGWFMQDPHYIRLAKLGVHAYLTSHMVKEPADLAWSDDQLATYFSQIKKRFDPEYNKAKRVVHGNNYGLTPFGMALQFPDVYHTVKEAEAVQDLYYALAPGLPAFQKHIQKTAAEKHFLGGSVPDTLRSGKPIILHPYGYKHWFWAIYAFEPITEGKAKTYAQARKRGLTHVPEVVYLNDRPYKIKLGDDAKRAIAFFPQSTASAILAEAELRLFAPGERDYIGEAYYGRTPLRAPIHDSLLLEIPDRRWDRTVESVVRVMTREIAELPIPPAWRALVPTLGECLSIGVEAKAGRDSWGAMEKINLEDYRARVPTVPTVEQLEAMPIVRDGWMPPEIDDADEIEERNDLSREITLH